MTDPTPQERIDAARAYEALFVPALFARWAPVVADAAGVRRGHHALDVGCGTGVLARELALLAGTEGRVAGIDPDPGMLAVAEALAPAVEWRAGFAESLPFPDQSFDAVASQFALMFLTDRRRGLREMLRVLRPGGRLAVAVWSSVASMPAYAAETALLERLAGRQAADALRAPFVLGDREELAALCSDAGLEAAEITTHRGTAEFPGIRTMVEADLRGWLPVMGVVLPEDLIERILGEAEEALAFCAAADGRAVFDVSAQVVSATRA